MLDSRPRTVGPAQYPALEHPFEYKLRIHGNDGLVEVPVDLVETFNLLMGLHVQRIRAWRTPSGSIGCGGLEDGRPVLVAWRDMTGFDPNGTALSGRALTCRLRPWSM